MKKNGKELVFESLVLQVQSFDLSQEGGEVPY
jgi:hypothetical protein